MHNKRKILFIVTSLNRGGAEAMLYKLVKQIDKSCYDIFIISLGEESDLCESLRALKVKVVSIDFKKILFFPLNFLRLIRTVKLFSPDVIQSWMYHADFMTIPLKPFLAKKTKIFWGVRNFNLDKQYLKWRTRFIIRLLAFFSHSVPDKIVTNAVMTRQEHVNIGYNEKYFIVIPNGFDTNVFKPIKSDHAIRQKIHANKDDKLLGYVARFDKIKNHADFILMVKQLLKRYPNLKAVLIGGGDMKVKAEMLQLVINEGLQDHIFFLGELSTTDALVAAYNELDLYVHPSMGESFSNAIGEAMACGIPCVVTDVGDAQYIVGDAGEVIPKENFAAFTESIKRLLSIKSDLLSEISRLSRERIQKHYSIENVVKRFEHLYNNE